MSTSSRPQRERVPRGHRHRADAVAAAVPLSFAFAAVLPAPLVAWLRRLPALLSFFARRRGADMPAARRSLDRRPA